MFDSFNHLASILILFVWSFLSPILPSRPIITHQVATPSAKLQSSSPSALVSIPVVTTAPVPWGQTEKIGDHLYRTYVGSDPAMGTPDEILTAINNYRHPHGAQEVHRDDGLCKLAQSRAQQQDKLGNLDEHKGLEDYMKDDNHWRELNITAIGENASYGYVLSGVHLIEWVFDSDVEHRSNQLNPQWNLACAGTSGVTVDIIFGKR